MTEPMIMIPKRILQMVKPEGFIKHFEERCKTMGKMDAYESLEEEHEQYFGFRRYSDYTSFKITLRRKRKL